MKNSDNTFQSKPQIRRPKRGGSEPLAEASERRRERVLCVWTLGAWELGPQGHTPHQTPSLASHHPGGPVSPIRVGSPFAHRPCAEALAPRSLPCCLHLPLAVPGGLEPVAWAAGSPAPEKESVRKPVPKLCISSPKTMCAPLPPALPSTGRGPRGSQSLPHQHLTSVGVWGSYSRAEGQVNTAAPPCG